MKLQAALKTVRPRLKKPLLLGIAITWCLFTALGIAFTRWIGPELGSPNYLKHPLWVDGLWSLIAPFNVFFLSPLPWLWTGDDRAHAPFSRGLLQALPFPLLESTLSSLIYLPPSSLGPPMVAYPSILALHVAEWLFIGYAIAGWERRVQRKAVAQEKAQEAQWTLLQSQMSPHAFLNALNGLAQLVREDLQAGLQGIRNLSEIYRMLLAHGQAQFLPLGKERDLLEQFLGVEALRLGRRLQVTWDWDHDLDPVPLPPLLLQPLVENAVKHGISASESGGILRISARRDGRDLRLSVSNTGLGLGQSPSPGTGIGLRNLEARLKLAFGPQGHLNLKTEGEWTVAEIHLEGRKA